MFLPTIPQSPTDLTLGLGDLTIGCVHGTYQESTKSYALSQVQNGSYISSAFVDRANGKGRFIMNLNLQSTHWQKRSVQMESISTFGACLAKGDHMLCFDWERGYRHMRLHKKMWNWFIFSYEDRFYRCISLPVGWTRSPFCFCHLLAPPSRYIRDALNCRLLKWIDDYLLVPVNGKVASTEYDCVQVCTVLDFLFPQLGLLRHPHKGTWGAGTTRIEHLSIIMDTVSFRYFITGGKSNALQEKSLHLLRNSAKSRRWV